MSLHTVVTTVGSSLYKVVNVATFGALPTIICGVSSSIWLLGRSVSIHRLISYATETVEGLEQDPPTFAAGVLLNITCGHMLTVKVAAKIALLASTIIDVSEKYNEFKKAWGDLAAIGENIPIEFIKHYCESLDSKERTLSTRFIRYSPKPFAKEFVRCADAAHYTKNFAKAFFALFAASIKFYYAVYTDELAGMHERNRFFIHIKKVYNALCENPEETLEKIKSHSKTIDKILRAANTSFRSEDLVQFLTPKEIRKKEEKKASSKENWYEYGKKIIYFTSFACIQTFTGVTRYFGSKENLPAPQPILERGPAHGNDGDPHATCKAGEKPKLGRYYKTSKRRGESSPA